MLGRSHLLLGSASWLAIASAAPELLGHAGRLSPAELGCGAILACGSAVAPDLDCPSSSISRCLGPVSQFLSRHIVSKIALGHRQGTHTLLAVLLVAVGVIVGVHSSDARWVELGIAFVCASMLFRVLLDGRGLVCVALAAATAAALITIAPHPGYFSAAIVVGYISHIFPGDFWTVEGVPALLWPLDRKRRMRLPLLGHTDGLREHVIAGALGLLAVWLLATVVFLPAWHAQSAEAATSRPTAVSHSAHSHPASGQHDRVADVARRARLTQPTGPRTRRASPRHVAR